jgi:hypothetical protein
VELLVEATATEVPDAQGISSSSPPEVGNSNWEKAESTQNRNASATSEASPHPWDQPIPGGASSEPEAPLSETPAVKAKSKQSVLPLAVAGAGLSLIVFSSTLYFLSRPCVMGKCEAISEAQELSQKSAETLQNPESGKAVLEAQEQLMDAIRMLESIPPWSSYHAKAQVGLKAYQAQAETVDEMVAALKTAARASYKSQDPPHPASTWIEIQGMWREAIAKLEQLSTKSNLQPLAKQKIKDYEANLAETKQRLVKERQAQGRLKEAKDAALIAEARQGVAQSLPHWQLVYATWLTALNRLKQIPQGTTAYEEAKQLSAFYQPKIASARDRKNQEQFATNAYNQGLRLAQRATNSQAINQWSVALTQWRNALTYINQVPYNTFYYGKAQALVAPYTAAVKQAQGQLQLALKLQQARSDLNQTCSGKTKVCNYVISSNAIRVQLTPTYMQMVRKTEITAKARGDSNTQKAIVNHILTLGEALEAISDNARLPLEVYTPEGNLIQQHKPFQR